MNRNFFLCVAAAMIVLSAGRAFAQPSGGSSLGSPTYMPSPEKPVGWRGDGTGRYPGAQPPTAWNITRSGAGIQGKGLIWASRMPGNGVGSPIVVGERIFVTAEPQDLIWLEKKTGRVLWIASCAEFEGLPADEKQGNPIYTEKLQPMMVQLAQANAQLVSALNGQGSVDGALKTKRGIEKQISDTQLSIDKKKFERYWAQAVFGFAGQTPASDGKHVVVFYTTGVTACYDMDGKRLWIARGAGGGSEHGNFASPIICGKTVVVWANEMRGYDIETGKLLWTVPAKSHNTYGSLFRIQVGGEMVAAFQSGYFVSIRDGQAIWDKEAFGDCVATPVVDGNVILAWIGYPRQGKAAFRAFKIPAGPDGKLTPGVTYNTDWGGDLSDKNFANSYCASPLLADGLIYQLTEGGGLMVNDAASGEQVYRKVLAMSPHTAYWNWAGASASPTLAGKYIYLMDNQGTTIVIEPGRQYKEVAKNVIEEPAGKEREQNLTTPVFDGTRMYYRTPGFLYCIGEK